MGAQAKTILEELAPATVYHMTHIKNLPSILEHGLLAHNNPYQQVDISNQAVNARRSHCETIYGRSVHDYVPLYFNPRNAMLYKTQIQYRSDIVMLGFSNEVLLMENSLFTNGNASSNGIWFSNDLESLNDINWNNVFSQSWYGYPESLKRTMMSEVLVHQQLGLTMLESIYCSNDAVTRQVKQHVSMKSIKITTQKDLFFGNLL